MPLRSISTVLSSVLPRERIPSEIEPSFTYISSYTISGIVGVSGSVYSEELLLPPVSIITPVSMVSPGSYCSIVSSVFLTNSNTFGISTLTVLRLLV